MKTYLVTCEHMMSDYETVLVVDAGTPNEAEQYVRDLGYFVYEVDLEPDEGE